MAMTIRNVSQVLRGGMVAGGERFGSPGLAGGDSVLLRCVHCLSQFIQISLALPSRCMGTLARVPPDPATSCEWQFRPAARLGSFAGRPQRLLRNAPRSETGH